MAKFIFVTGGVVSGIGKGIAAASLARLLKNRGYKVFMQKFDPYINVDPGLMDPLEHGEVFVTADGLEADLDLGHYERFIDEELNYTSSITSGKVYLDVINKERSGAYGGATVQVIPHITNEIKAKVFEAAKTSGAEIIITEIGGTVGDIESLPHVEALRQIRQEIGKDNCLFVHVTLLPYIFGSYELKTKPTQQSVHLLRSYGIQPDFLICRTPIALPIEQRKKIAMFCNVENENVIEAIDSNNIYNVPLNFHMQKLDSLVLEQLKLKKGRIKLNEWKNLVKTVDGLKKEITVAIVGKYTTLHDAYLSVMEALKHAGYQENVKVKIKWVASVDLEKKRNLDKVFKGVKGIVVPGGFDGDGTAGKVKAITYARENNIPFLGIGLGMQLAIIELARNICNLKGADSTEWNEQPIHPVIRIPQKQLSKKKPGVILRLGNFDVKLDRNTKAYDLYKKKEIQERHRNSYEFNNEYESVFAKRKIVFSGYNEKSGLVEIIELPKHKFFIGCSYHPEFKSRPTKSHPLFDGFIKACIK